MGPSCFGGCKICGLWRLDPLWMRGDTDSEMEMMEGERWRVMLPLPALWLVHWSAAEAKLGGRAADGRLLNRLIHPRLRGISSTWCCLKTNQLFHLCTTCLPPRPRSRAVENKGTESCSCSPPRTRSVRLSALKLLFSVVYWRKVRTKINLIVN